MKYLVPISQIGFKVIITYSHFEAFNLLNLNILPNDDCIL